MRQRLWVIAAALAAVGLLIASQIWPNTAIDDFGNLIVEMTDSDSAETDTRPLAPKGDGPTITVFAASSTASVIQQIGQIYEQDVAVDIVVVPAASSVLARQIDEGAPAQIFISANTQWTDYLIAQGKASEDYNRVLMTNRLALVAPKSGEWSNEAGVGTSWDPQATLTEQLTRIISLGRLAICEPENVPCGQYAKQTLETLGLWDRAQHNLAIGNNALATLSWVERGEVPGGLVYMTEVRASSQVDLITFVPDGFHQPILYDALLLDYEDDDAQGFAQFLIGTVAQRVLIAAGFIPTNIVDIKSTTIAQ